MSAFKYASRSPSALARDIVSREESCRATTMATALISFRLILGSRTSILERHMAALEGAVAEEVHNPNDIICKRCSSIIVKAQVATRVIKEVGCTTHMLSCSALCQTCSCAGSSRTQRRFRGPWCLIVGSSRIFSPSRTWGSARWSNRRSRQDVLLCPLFAQYLACADCEIGPIGWQDTSVPNEIFVAHERVAFKE